MHFFMQTTLLGFLLMLTGLCIGAPPAATTVASVDNNSTVVDKNATVVDKNSTSEPKECVYFPENLCPPPNEICRCLLVSNGSAALCCNISVPVQLKEGLNCPGLARANITSLHVRNATLKALDLRMLHSNQLESLAVTDGNITELDFYLVAPSLGCLNLSTNGLQQVKKSAISTLKNLHNLDLSSNNLQHLPELNVNVPQFRLDISGNNKLDCLSIMGCMKTLHNSTELQFSHDSQTYCLTSQSFHWFNSTDKVPLSSVVMLNKLEQDCPRGEGGDCICDTLRLDIVPGKLPTYSFSVDCSGLRLTELPKDLPRNTVSLNVSNNKISNLELLSVSDNYKDIRFFYADDNQITSITALEGSSFIESFRYLSLRRNNISLFPTYILSNVIDRNTFNERTVQLGLNRLKCDCSTVQTVKMWLNANKKHIPDYDEVLCENMPDRVWELDQNKVCIVQSDWTDYVYYLVAAEVLLLLLLISKVSYDYWVFKTAGYLPWPASKMPKLPCDWVFE